MNIRFLAALALPFLAGCDAQARTFDEAANAYAQNRVTEAESALRALAEAPGAAAGDRARALRELARISWLVDGNAQASLRLLAKAEQTGEGGCENSSLVARILDESGQDARLLGAAPVLAARCTSPADAADLRLSVAAAAVDAAASPSAVPDRAIAEAERRIAELDPDQRASLEGSELRLRVALRRSDPEAALQAWKDYFWLSSGDVPQGISAAYPAAAPVFAAALAPDAGVAARLQLVDLLVRAGFAAAAEGFARSAGLPQGAGGHPLWRKAAAYFNERRALEHAILQSNRKVARGGKAADLDAAAERMRRALLAAIDRAGGGDADLREAYGLHGRVGDTDGFRSVHYGHIVQNERRRIEQYGHRAEVGFLALDNMISNGFNSWLWDGRAAAGGWAEPDQTIVQVRPEYTSGPLRAWRLFSGGGERGKLVARQQERAAADLAALEGRDVAYLPGLADRLRLQVADQIGVRARSLAGGGDLRRAFLQEYWRATFQQSMLTHEGRHALDRELVRWLARFDDANLEYRAKLSELALAEYPRLALVNINDPTIGSGNAHGKANERVLRELASWIDKNRGRVAGFEPSRPAMVQIDRLTDAQLRDIARSLDPIATSS